MLFTDVEPWSFRPSFLCDGDRCCGQLLHGHFDAAIIQQESEGKPWPASGRKAVATSHDWRCGFCVRSVLVWGISHILFRFRRYTDNMFLQWTRYTKNILWIAPCLSGLLTGFGFISIFMPFFIYLIDTYLHYAASAISANTLMRSAFGAGFP